MPTLNDEVASVALPPLKLAVPSVVAPSRKVTVPVGVPDPGAAALTVAVNVTLCPMTVGFCDELTFVEVEAVFTVWLMAADVLALKLLSPA